MRLGKEERRLSCWPKRLPCVWILLGHVTAAAAVKVTVAADRIQVVQGGSALLPCAFHTTAPLSRLNIIWTVVPSTDPSRPQQVLAYEQGKVVESLSHYKGRVNFAFLPTTSATIVLNDTRSSDSGTYQCSVINPPDGSTPNIGIVRLTVFVPPSNLQCSSEGNREEGSSLRFTCTVGEGLPVPTLTWEKIPPAAQPLVMSYEDDRRALLALQNLTAEASGLYRCTASNILDSTSCALELRVHPAPHGATSLVVGVALMLCMGLVLLTLFALALWLHQRGSNKWAQPEEEDSCNEVSTLCRQKPFGDAKDFYKETPWDQRIDSFSLGRLILTKSPSRDVPTTSPITKPLWIFTSTAPNTTCAHREWRPPPGSGSQVPEGPRPPAAACLGKWRTSSLPEQQRASLGSEEEEHAGPSPSPKRPGFLV